MIYDSQERRGDVTFENYCVRHLVEPHSNLNISGFSCELKSDDVIEKNLQLNSANLLIYRRFKS